MKQPHSQLDALLQEARRAADPGSQLRSQVRAALQARIAAGDPGPPEGGSAAEEPPPAPLAGPGQGSYGASGPGAPPPAALPPSSATGLLTFKAGLVVAGSLLGLVASVLWVKSHQEAAPPPAVEVAPSNSAPPPADPSAAVTADASATPPPTASGTGTAEPAGTTARTAGGTKSTDPSDLLREETAQLRQAQQALRSGQASRAMTMLDEQGRLFARGVLGQERMVTRILALCALGRRGEAQRLAAAVERSSPRSPHLPTLRSSCARQDP